MDSLTMMVLTLAGVVAMCAAAARPGTHIMARLVAWFASFWMLVYFVRLTWLTNPLSLFEWSGDAEIGPLTLAFIVLAFCWLWLGSRNDALNN